MTEQLPEPVPARQRDGPHHTHLLTEQIITAVADATNTTPHELPPLYEAINPDALNRLFAPTYTGDSRADGRITFLYADHEVVIHGSDVVAVKPVDR